MTTKFNYVISALLILSAVLLGVLVPGGPIETRSFSHIDPLVLGIFNTFLTSLGIGSIAIAYFVWQNRSWTGIASLICGLSYLLVYLLDLGKIFPVSPVPMPPMLLLIEVLGTIVAFPLICTAAIAIINNRNSPQTATVGEQTWVYSHQFGYAPLWIILIGVSIIAFATKSAMGI